MIKHLSLWNACLRDEFFDTGGRGRRGAESSTAGCKHSAQMPGRPSQAIIIPLIDWSSDVLFVKSTGRNCVTWVGVGMTDCWTAALSCSQHVFFNCFWGGQGSHRTAARFRSCVREIGYIQTDAGRETWFLNKEFFFRKKKKKHLCSTVCKFPI